MAHAGNVWPEPRFPGIAGSLSAFNDWASQLSNALLGLGLFPGKMTWSLRNLDLGAPYLALNAIYTQRPGQGQNTIAVL